MRIILRSTNTSDNAKHIITPAKISDGPVFKSVPEQNIPASEQVGKLISEPVVLDPIENLQTPPHPMTPRFGDPLTSSDGPLGGQMAFGFWEQLKTVHPDLKKKPKDKKPKNRKK